MEKEIEAFRAQVRLQPRTPGNPPRLMSVDTEILERPHHLRNPQGRGSTRCRTKRR
jgi:hypothetical protein